MLFVTILWILAMQWTSGYLNINIKVDRSRFMRKILSKQSKFLFSTHATNSPLHINYPGFAFNVTKVDPKSDARLGTIVTPHGMIETPNFIFCATKAAMKSVTTQQLRAENTQIMLSNTYHLMLQPGADIIEHLGGLQKMTGWNGPMLTDSGGYQIFSMGYGSVSNEIKGKRFAQQTQNKSQSLLEINEEGAKFRSYVDGTIHTLTPESSIQIQRKLGADLILVLDECTPFHVEQKYTKESMFRSHRWAVRSLQEFVRTQNHSSTKLPQALYGIIQGGIYPEYRQESVDFANKHPFFGIAIGGSLGANKEGMYSIVKYTCDLLKQSPKTYSKRPIHLLGIGGIRDIFYGVRQGIDTFDCVHPSRLGRHGGALVMKHFWDEDINLHSSSTSSSSSSTIPSNGLENHHISSTMLEAISNKCEKLFARLQEQEVTYRQQYNIRQLRLEILGNVDETSVSDKDLQIARAMEDLDAVQLKLQEIETHYEQVGYLAAFLQGQIQCYRKQLPTMAMTSNVGNHGTASSSMKKSRFTIKNILERSSFSKSKKAIPSLWDQKIIDSKSPYRRYVTQLLNSIPQSYRMQHEKSLPNHASSRSSNESSIGGSVSTKRTKVHIREHMNLASASMRLDSRPIDSTCTCYTCKNFSRGYLHHLFKAEEAIGGTLVSIHNVHFMNRLMKDIREGIASGTLDEVESKYVHPDLTISIPTEGISPNVEE